MHPVVRLLPGEDRRLRRGHPWAFANELSLDGAVREILSGTVVTLADARGAPLGTGTFNLHSLIAVRLYDPRPEVALDAAWFDERLGRALALREKLFDAPYYRWIHAEGDGLPGTVVDRHGSTIVVQANTAGAERLLEPLLSALERRVAPTAIVLRNDSPARALEGLAPQTSVARGSTPESLEVHEGACRFLVDALAGQKTGWYYDLAPARSAMARLARGGRVLDLYCHLGGFALHAARAGARSVLALDRSEPALELARASAKLNGLTATCTFARGEVFEELGQLARADERFDCVIADPPSFVKSRRELKVGLQGYRKLTRLAAACVVGGGFLFIASCSHHVSDEAFAESVARGLVDARRTGRVVQAGGAGPDHPVHPLLPETAYLKYRILQLD